MNAVKKFLNNKYLLLSIVIFIILLKVFYLFTFVRDGHHSDEAWSYGFSNSYYSPYLTLELGEDIYNFTDSRDVYTGEWNPSSVFSDYLTVNEGERFSYLSVIDNKKGDASPPLYEILLHTICSFFPGEFSWWYSFLINIVFYIGTLIVLFLIVDTLCESYKLFGRATPFLVCLFYGLSSMGISTVLCLRMYCLATFLFLLLIYLVQKYISNKLKNVPFFVSCAIVVLLGALTHFYFLAAAFFLILFSCVILLMRKRFASMFVTGFSALLGVLLFWIVYPYGFMEIFSERTAFVGKAFHYGYYVSRGVEKFLNYSLGVSWYIDSVTFLEIFAIFFWVLLFAVAIYFVFRNEKWMKRVVAALKGIFPRMFAFIRSVITREDPVILIMIFVFALYFAFATKFSDVIKMGQFAIRYYMIVGPLFVIILFSFLSLFFNMIGINNKASIIIGSAFACLAVLSLISQSVFFEAPYAFRDNEDSKLIKQLENKNVIIVSDTGWYLEWLSADLLKSKTFYHLKMDRYLDFNDVMNSYEIGEIPDDCVMLVYSSVFPDEDYMSDDGVVTFEFGSYQYSITQTEDDFIEAFINKYEGNITIEKIFETESSFAGCFNLYSVNNK